MSTIEDFENAPVGATATRPGVPTAVKVADRPRIEGNWDDGFVKMTVETLVDYDYALNPAAPTSAREALDLAWDLAHPVKEGQKIPSGIYYLRRKGDAPHPMSHLWHLGTEANGFDENTMRTLDPLPDPEPDWLNAPAVTAVHETHYSVPSVWVPHLHQKGDWTNAITGKTFPWQELTDVTPLYPKEDA